MTYLYHPHGLDKHARLNRLCLLLALVLLAWGWSEGVAAAEPTHVAACFVDEPSGTPVFDGSGYSLCATSWVSTPLSEVTADTRILVMPSLTATDEEKLFQRAGDVNPAWCSWDPSGAGDFCPFSDYWTEDGEEPEEPGEEDVIDFLQSGRSFAAAFVLCAVFWGMGHGIGMIVRLARNA